MWMLFDLRYSIALHQTLFGSMFEFVFGRRKLKLLIDLLVVREWQKHRSINLGIQILINCGSVTRTYWHYSCIHQWFSFGLLFRKLPIQTRVKIVIFLTFTWNSDRIENIRERTIDLLSFQYVDKSDQQLIIHSAFCLSGSLFGVYNDVYAIISQNACANVLRFHHLPLQVFISWRILFLWMKRRASHYVCCRNVLSVSHNDMCSVWIYFFFFFLFSSFVQQM